MEKAGFFHQEVFLMNPKIQWVYVVKNIVDSIKMPDLLVCTLSGKAVGIYYDTLSEDYDAPHKVIEISGIYLLEVVKKLYPEIYSVTDNDLYYDLTSTDNLEIPEKTFSRVGELLAFVYNLNGRINEEK